MFYKMFIDDERFPPEGQEENYIVCRNLFDVQVYVYHYGCPSFISFDHDLGEDVETGYEIAKWIVDCDIKGTITIPDDFDFYVHSQNPVGKKNIECFLNNYLDFRKGK